MGQNVFINTPDPLLTPSDYQTPGLYDRYIAELQQKQQAIEIQKQRYLQTQGQAQQSQSPVWDEIDRLTSELSDAEFDYVNADEDFQRSQQRVMAVLQREYMRVMRPIVEGTKEGKDALDNHLELLKSLKKRAAKEASKNMELFNEYTEHYSDIPFSEFMKMKKGKATKPTKK